MVQNFDGGKYWWIWRISINSSIFSLSKFSICLATYCRQSGSTQNKIISVRRLRRYSAFHCHRTCLAVGLAEQGSLFLVHSSSPIISVSHKCDNLEERMNVPPYLRYMCKPMHVLGCDIICTCHLPCSHISRHISCSYPKRCGWFMSIIMHMHITCVKDFLAT